MADFPSTNVRINSQISPFTDTQTFPLFDTAHGLGGLRTVGTTADLNNIFDRRRTRGMMVYVSGVSAYYALIGTTANSGWTTEFQMGTGTNILPLNNTFTGTNTFSGGVTFSGTVNGATATFSRVLTAPSIAFNSSFATISGFCAAGAYPKAIFDGNSVEFKVLAGPWALGLQEESFLGYPYEASIIADPNTGVISIDTQTISSNASQFTLLGGISAGGSSTFNGTLTGRTASFSRLVTATQGITSSSLNTTSIQAYGGSTFDSTLYVGATLTVAGNFVVNGTTTTINSTTISVDDKNIELGSVTSPTDTTADGGGISLKGATDKTIVWSNVTSGTTLAAAWNFNQDINLTKSTNPAYYINGTVVIDGASLGPNIVNSNLTKVGTISTGVWQGTVVGATYGGTGFSSYAKGDILYAAAAGSALSKLAVSSTQGQLIQADGAGLFAWGDLLIADASGNGVSSLSGGKYRIQDASTSAKGLARFSSSNFTVASGVVEIDTIEGGVY